MADKFADAEVTFDEAINGDRKIAEDLACVRFLKAFQNVIEGI
jgi:hypothetical protein